MWLPMVPGDDRDAAVENSRTWSDARVLHAWDGERWLGRLATATFVERHGDLLERAALGIEEIGDRLEQLSASAEDLPPAWDVALFFERGAEWRGELPEPAAWSRQFRFGFDPTTGDAHGSFWTEAAPLALTPSSWRHEFARGLARVGEPRSGT